MWLKIISKKWYNYISDIKNNNLIHSQKFGQYPIYASYSFALWRVVWVKGEFLEKYVGGGWMLLAPGCLRQH